MTFFLAPLMTLLYNENNNERVVIMFELVKVSPDDIRSIELLIEYRGKILEISIIINVHAHIIMIQNLII